MVQQAAPATVTKIPRNAVRRPPFRWFSVIVEPRIAPRDQLIQKPVYTCVSAGRDIVQATRRGRATCCGLDTAEDLRHSIYLEPKTRLTGAIISRVLCSVHTCPNMAFQCYTADLAKQRDASPQRSTYQVRSCAPKVLMCQEI